MTQKQKIIILAMLDGGSIAAYGNNFRLRDTTCTPVMKFTYKTFKPISDYLRKKDGLYTLDKVAIRKMRKNSWIKQTYLSKQNEKKQTI